MLNDSKPSTNGSGIRGSNDGSCAGGMQKSERVFRRLKSTKDGRVKITQRIPKDIPFDPTAWYLYEVKRNKELAIREIFSKKDLGFNVEVYVAAQINLKRKRSPGANPYQEKVVIHGKIFVRVDEAHRVDVMKECPYITYCVTERSSALSKKSHNEVASFVRIPDIQIQRVRKVLDMADGLVEYSEHVPQPHDNIQVIGGQLVKGTLFKDVKGEILMTNGRKEAIVILDGVGCLKFKLPIEDIAKVRKKQSEK